MRSAEKHDVVGGVAADGEPVAVEGHELRPFRFPDLEVGSHAWTLPPGKGRLALDRKKVGGGGFRRRAVTTSMIGMGKPKNIVATGPSGDLRIEYIEGRRALRVTAGAGDGPVEVPLAT